jgi:hypothetical protein
MKRTLDRTTTQRDGMKARYGVPVSQQPRRMLGYLRERGIDFDKMTEHLHRRETFGKACHSVSRFGRTEPP